MRVTLVRRSWLLVGLVVALAGLPGVAPAAGAATLGYSVTRLHLPKGEFAHPTGLNDHGYVVGWDEEPSEVSFVWTPSGRATRLPTLSGNGDFALAISNDGVIVGEALPRPVGDTSVAVAVVWQTSSSRPARLPTLGGQGGYAAAVNEDGVIAGGLFTRTSDLSRAVIWRGGAVHVLDPSGFIETGASDINDRGTVIGWGCDAAECAPVAWRADGTRRVLSGHLAQAHAINDHGTVVGTTAAPDFSTLPTVWRGNSQMTLPRPDGVSSDEVEPEDVNNAGLIVGTLWRPRGGDSGWNTNGPNGVLWRHGNIYRLASLARGAPGFHVGSVYRINQAGQITVEAWDANWQGPALLTPLPSRTAG